MFEKSFQRLQKDLEMSKRMADSLVMEKHKIAFMKRKLVYLQCLACPQALYYFFCLSRFSIKESKKKNSIMSF